jgi:branched-chain amino acid aminotransferase
LIYIDGQFYEKAEAKISVYDHGFLYGDGVFEGIRIYNRRIFKLKEHLKRLYESAQAIYLRIGMEPAELEELLTRMAEQSGKANGYIRLVVSRGDGPLGIDPSQCPRARMVIILDDIQLYPAEFYEKGIAIITSSYRRIPVECFDLRIKSLNYLNSVLAKNEARQHNCLESVMLNTNGFVAECTGDNIFIVKDGILKTPAAYHGALAGITRGVVLEIGDRLGLKPVETTLTRFDLYNADECFLSGTGAEIIPVVSIDGIKIGDGGPGVTTGKVVSLFQDLVNEGVTQ